MSLLDDENYWKDQMTGRDDYKEFEGRAKRIVEQWSGSDKYIEECTAIRKSLRRFNTDFNMNVRVLTEHVTKGETYSEKELKILDREFSKFLYKIEGEASRLNSVPVKERRALTDLEKLRIAEKKSEINRLVNRVSTYINVARNVASRESMRLRNAQITAAENFLYRQQLIENGLSGYDVRLWEKVNQMRLMLDEYAGKNEKLRDRFLSSWSNESVRVKQLETLGRLRVDVAEVVTPRIEDYYNELEQSRSVSDKTSNELVRSKRDVMLREDKYLDSVKEKWSERAKNLEDYMGDVEKRQSEISRKIIDSTTKIENDLQSLFSDTSNLRQVKDNAAARNEVVDRMLNRLAVAEVRHFEEIRRAQFDVTKAAEDGKRIFDIIAKRMESFYTMKDLQRIGEVYREDYKAGEKLIDELFEHWRKHRNYTKEELKFIEGLIGKSDLERRMRLLLQRDKAPTTAQIEDAMRAGARLALYEKKQRLGISAFLRFAGDTSFVMNGGGNKYYTFLHDDWLARLNRIEDEQTKKWREVRAAAIKMQGEKLAPDALKNFAKFVSKEARNLQKARILAVETKEMADKKFREDLLRQYREECKKSGAKYNGLKGMAKNAPVVLSVVEDICGYLKALFDEMLVYGIKNDKLPDDFKPRLVKFLKGVFKGIGFLFEGFVVGFIIDAIMDKVADIWVDVLKMMVRDHKKFEDLLSYELMCGVTVERLGYNIWSVDVSTKEVIAMMVIRIIGLMLAESSVNSEQLSDIVNFTLENNSRSLVASMRNERRKLTAMAINALNYETVLLYSEDSAAVSSRCIVHVAYHVERNVLYIGFNDKKKTVYMYPNVPFEVVNSFMWAAANSSSVGAWFNYNIRPNYKSYRRFEVRGSVNAAVGMSGKLEKKRQVERNNQVTDERAELYVSPKVKKNVELMEALLKVHGAYHYSVDSDGRVHFYYG